MSTAYSGDGITFPDSTVQATAPKVGMVNRIINGDMRIDQRNAGASVTPTASAYTLDRFIFLLSQASKFSVQQNAGAVTPPVGFTNYLGATSLSAYSVLTADLFVIAQRIEGYNISDLAWGTANAKTVTVSFWVRSSLTGTFGGALRNDAANRSYPFSYTISSANTWEQKSVTIAGDTTGTWRTDGGTGINLYFGLGVGATYSGTAGAWSANNLLSATGATSVVGTSGATFYLTGVQLEKGSVATDFEYVDYGRQLIQCQRYFQHLNCWWECAQGSAGNLNSSVVGFSTTMRAAPTITAVSSSGSGNSVIGYTIHSKNGVFYGYSISYSSSTTGYGYRQETDSLNAEL